MLFLVCQRQAFGIAMAPKGRKRAQSASEVSELLDARNDKHMSASKAARCQKDRRDLKAKVERAMAMYISDRLPKQIIEIERVDGKLIEERLAELIAAKPDGRLGTKAPEQLLQAY